MNTIEQTVRGATVIYMPKGKEVAECTGLLKEMNIVPPQLDDKSPQGVDAEGRLYTRLRATDAVRRVARRGGIAFAGTDVCDKLIGPDSNLEYATFGTDKPPMCTFELLVPQDAPPSFFERLQGDGQPLVVVTSAPRMLARCALERGFNIVASNYVPDGGVEIIAKMMIEEGEADAAADIVQLGNASRVARFWSSKSKNRPNYYPIDPVLQAIYGAVISRKPEVE